MKVARILAVTAGVLAIGAGAALAGPRVSHAFGMDVSFAVAAEPADGCSNNPGPYIRLAGQISLGGLNAQLRFSNNQKGTHVHTEDVVTTLNLVSDEPIMFEKQPSRGGVGGNPHVFLLLHDGDGGAMGDPIYLGRCVQGFSDAAVDLILPALAEGEVTGGGCSGQGGPNITLEGGLALGGLSGTLVFTNNNNAFTHVHEEDVTVELELIPDGETIVFPKQPPLGGAGGNPHVFLQFQDSAGNPLGDELYLGRCNSL
jgi:hypothetical protein